MGPTEWALLALLALLWGGSFFFTKIALAAIPPLTLVLGRVALASLTLALALARAGVPFPRQRHVWIAFFGMGLLNNVVPFSLLFWGQTAMPKEVASSLASILNATTPIFTVLVAHVLTRDERLNACKLAGVLFGFAGVAIMLAPSLGTAPRLSGNLPLLGMLACLAAAFVYACAGVFGRRFERLGVTALQSAFGQVTASSVIMAPVAAILDRPWTLPMPMAAALAALTALAVISTALGYVLYFRILARAGATNLLLVTFLIPVVACALGLLLGERLGLVHLIGMGFIGAGLAAVDGRLLRRLRPRPLAPAG
ncbi:MAG: DMT family transporter [Methylobacteriaceae bacterium]|nr:DMT family transporter [Methylobacteriaceae bacterium]